MDGGQLKLYRVFIQCSLNVHSGYPLLASSESRLNIKVIGFMLVNGILGRVLIIKQLIKIQCRETTSMFFVREF